MTRTCVDDPPRLNCGRRVDFALYADGRVVYRATAGEVRVAHVEADFMNELLWTSLQTLLDQPREIVFACFCPLPPGTEFEIHTTTLDVHARVADNPPQPAGAPLQNWPEMRALAKRLGNFESEVRGGSQPLESCSPTPGHTIAPDRRVDWNKPTWQDTGAGVWVTPLDWKFDEFYTVSAQDMLTRGFPSEVSYDLPLELEFWAPDRPKRAFGIDATRMSDAPADEFTFRVDVYPEPWKEPPGPHFAADLYLLSPGCYTFSVTTYVQGNAVKLGSVVEFVGL